MDSRCVSLDLEKSSEELLAIIIEENDEEIKAKPAWKCDVKEESTSHAHDIPSTESSVRLKPISDLLKTLSLSDSLVDLNKQIIKDKEKVINEYGKDFSKQDQQISEKVFNNSFLNNCLYQPYPPLPYNEFEDKQMHVGPIYVYPVQTAFEVEEDRYEGQFNNRKIRNQFISKVFSILFTQLLITFLFIYLTITVQEIKQFVQKEFLLSVVFIMIEIVIYITLICSETCRRTTPLNYILLGIFTVATSYVAAFISVHYDTDTVLLAFGSTAGITAVVGLVAWTNCVDITSCGFVLYMILISTMIFSIFVTVHIMMTGSYTLYYILLYLMLVVVIVSLLFNMELIIGKGQLALAPEEYIFAALTLYVTIKDIFIILLQILSRK